MELTGHRRPSIALIALLLVTAVGAPNALAAVHHKHHVVAAPAPATPPAHPLASGTQLSLVALLGVLLMALAIAMIFAIVKYSMNDQRHDTAAGIVALAIGILGFWLEEHHHRLGLWFLLALLLLAASLASGWYLLTKARATNKMSYEIAIATLLATIGGWLGVILMLHFGVHLSWS